MRKHKMEHRKLKEYRNFLLEDAKTLQDLLNNEPYYNESLAFATKEEKNNKDFVLKKIRINPEDLYFASEKIKNDKEVLLVFLEARKDFSKIMCQLDRILKKGEKLTDEILCDEEIKKLSYYESPEEKINILKDSSTPLSKAKEILIKNPHLYQFFGIEKIKKWPLEEKFFFFSQDSKKEEILNSEERQILGTREDLLFKLISEGCNVFFKYPHLIENKKFILDAFALADISVFVLEANEEKISRDLEICEASIKWNTYNLRYFSRSIQKNKEIMEKVLKQNPAEFMEYYDLFKNNKKFLNDNVHQMILCDFNRTKKQHCLSDNESFVKKLVSFNGINLAFASNRLRKNKEIVETAIKNNPSAVAYAAKEYWTEEAWLKAIVKKPFLLLEKKDVFFDKFKDNKPLAYFLTSHDKNLYMCLSERLKADEDIVLNVLVGAEYSDYWLNFISEQLKADRKFWYKVEGILDPQSVYMETINKFKMEDKIWSNIDNVTKENGIKIKKKI